MDSKKERRLALRLSDAEYDLIRQQMTLVGTENMSAFVRKMATHGMIIKLNLPEIRDMLALLRRANANINQIAKRLNETNRIYDTDLDEIKGYQEQIRDTLHTILMRLNKL